MHTKKNRVNSVGSKFVCKLIYYYLIFEVLSKDINWFSGLWHCVVLQVVTDVLEGG
jgi:hypothetical protein